MTVVVHRVHSWLERTETWLYNQVRMLPETVECHVLAETTANLDQYAIGNLHVLRTESPWRYRWETGLRRLHLRHHLPYTVHGIRKAKADILHSHYGHCAWRDLGAVRRTGVKHVVTFYGLDVSYLPRANPAWERRYRQLFASVDRVLCEGPFMAGEIRRMGCPTDKVHVHHLGVSVDEIAYRPRVWRPGTPLRLLMAASFREKKGIPYGLMAVAELARKVPVELTLIGDEGREPRARKEKVRILDTLKRTGLARTTRLLGYQPYRSLMEEAYRHHVFLAPSVTAEDGDTEGGAPVSVIEMAASGMPIVATAHCDIPEVLPSDVSRHFAKERDVAGLTTQLERLVETPEAWSPRLDLARQWVEEEFDARTQGQRLAAIYQEISCA